MNPWVVLVSEEDFKYLYFEARYVNIHRAIINGKPDKSLKCFVFGGTKVFSAGRMSNGC